MTILISSANALIRDRWKQILQNHHQLLEASTTSELKKIINQHTIDLILLHRSMVDMEAISTLSKARFFILCDTPDDNEAITLLKLGAVGYTNTYISAIRLQEAVHTALTGKVWIGQKLMQRIIKGTTPAINTKLDEIAPKHNLSEREWEVAVLVSKGKSNLEIAADRNISERTVKAHISSIFKKTKTESRLQIALYINTLLSQ